MFAAVAFAGTMLAAQDPQPTANAPDSPAAPATTQAAPRPQSPTGAASASQDQSLTGCLVQGSGPTVFLLENAKAAGSVGSMASERSSAASAGAAAGKTYVVTASATTIDLKGQLNHQVTISGMGDISSPSVSAPSQSAKASEKDMPKFTAKTITKISDTCSSAG